MKWGSPPRRAPDSELEKPIVFLSSVYREEVGGEMVDLKLRDHIKEASLSLGIDLRAHSIGKVLGSADDIIDRCFRDIKECDLFVYLQTKRHGSGVAYQLLDRTVATYLELELFAAALLRKPMLILQQAGVEPEPGLLELLDLIEPSFGDHRRLLGDTDKLIANFKSEVMALATRAREETRLRHVPDALSALRARATLEQDFDQPQLLFLGGLKSGNKGTGSFEIAQSLVNEVAMGTDFEQRPMSHGAAIFRLWAAIRELHSVDRRSLEVSLLWDRLLGLWSRKVSWFGVHGHLFMGPLAAVNSQIQLRAGHPSISWADGSREPITAKASATYSIALNMTTRERRRRHLEESVWLSEKATPLDTEGAYGALAVRGYALIRLGMLERSPRLIFQAKDDFRTQLGMREGSASEADVGEAEFDLGFATFLGLRPFRGLELMEAGLQKMRNDGSANGIARLARALRSYERVGRALRPLKTARAREERLALARQVDAQDQLRDFG